MRILVFSDTHGYIDNCISEVERIGKVDMISLVKEILIEEARRGEGIVFRPDHGRHLEIDRARKSYSGYDYGGRLVGLAELRGLAYGIEHELKLGRV